MTHKMKIVIEELKIGLSKKRAELKDHKKNTHK